MKTGNMRGIALKCFRHLDRQFARRRQHQGLRCALLDVDAGKNGECEGGRFAGWRGATPVRKFASSRPEICTERNVLFMKKQLKTVPSSKTRQTKKPSGKSTTRPIIWIGRKPSGLCCLT